MALGNISIPLYSGEGLDKGKELFMDEFGGRCNLAVKRLGDDTEIQVSFYWEDLEKAWNAVKVDKD